MTAWAGAEEATAAKIHFCEFCALHIRKGDRYMRRGDVREGVYSPKHAHMECHHNHIRAERDAAAARLAAEVDPAALTRCRAQFPHADSNAAKRAAKRMRNRRRGWTPNVRTFKCAVCGYWHIGKK